MTLQQPAKDRQSALLQWLRIGAQLHQQDKLAEAETYYAAILKSQPNHEHARHLLGVLRLQQGRYADAVTILKQVAIANPGNAAAHSDLGNALGKLSQLEDALTSYDRAIALKPDFADVIGNRAAVLIELKRPDEALAECDKALTIKPDYAEAHYNRGKALLDLNRPQEALASYDTVLALKPQDADALNSRGLALMKLKRFEDALASINISLNVRPGSPDALNNQGVVLLNLKRPEDALDSFDQAVAVNPRYAEAFDNRGIALNHLKRPEEALEQHLKAIVLRENYPEAYNNCANALRALDRPQEALAYYDRAIEQKPDDADAIGNRGIVLNQLGRQADALASFEAALAIQPENSEARFSRGLVRLLTGNLPAAWADYELRFDQPEFARHPLAADLPTWSGEAIAGKRIIVTEEQGLGDVIQFSRYLPLLAAQGADVTFLVKPKLHRLLASLSSAIRLVDRVPQEPFDFHCALMSLPGIFQTTLPSIPGQTPYLAADPRLSAHWQQRIGDSGVRIGIVWQGNPTGNADIGRSFPLYHLAPLAGLPGVRLISLQKNHGLEQLDALPATMRVETLGSDFDTGPDAFADTAAVMANLDLIITSDTSVAHLAGSLGRPTWVALKAVPDWRWLLERADSPWYPTIRLYRQATRGDWSGVFAQMTTDLSRFRRA